jgi:ketosteroid isomerase-like protein
MYKKITLIMLLAIVIAGTTQAQSKKEKQVTAAVETLRKGMIDGDRTTLENIAATSLTYGHSGGHIDDKKEFVEKLAGGSSDFVTIDLSEQTITVTGNTAIVRHNLVATTNDGGKPATVKLKVLLVWQKLNGGWKMIARQAVKLT